MEMELWVQLNSFERYQIVELIRLCTGCLRHGEDSGRCCEWQSSDLSN